VVGLVELVAQAPPAARFAVRAVPDPVAHII
jgi:hypothetical protein